jgi:imidazolonepropionase-like amidohydrolase
MLQQAPYTSDGPANDVDEVCLALLDLARRAACCGGAPVVGASGATRPSRRARAATRWRHRTPAASRRFVLPEVTLVEPTVSRTVGDLLVAERRIVDLLPPRSATPEGYDRLDAYRGAFVTPSLIDMHGHLPPHNALGLAGRFLLLNLAHGVGTVRDAGDIDGTATAPVRDGLAKGRFIGPRLFSSGPFITKPPVRWINSLIVDGPEDAARIVSELQRQGMQCMKLYENLTVEEIAALERAAREAGLVTLGHVPTQLGLEEAPLADAQHFLGVPPPRSLPRDHVLDRVSHWVAVDPPRIDAIVRACVDGRRANTPTLVLTERLLAAGSTGRLDDATTRLLPRFYRDVVWHPRYGLPVYRDPTPARAAQLADAFEKKLALVGRLHREGATLRLGTDTQQPFVVPGAALHQEMKLFARAGVAASDVLRMATRDAALALGRTDLGTTRTGAMADLIVCGEDPSVDLDAMASIRAVVHDGAIYSRDALDSELAEDLLVRDRAFERIAAHVTARLIMWRTGKGFVA